MNRVVVVPRSMNRNDAVIASSAMSRTGALSTDTSYSAVSLSPEERFWPMS